MATKSKESIYDHPGETEGKTDATQQPTPPPGAPPLAEPGPPGSASSEWDKKHEPYKVPQGGNERAPE